MRQAIELARRGEGATSPNPLVGAVLVSRGRVIAEGYHPRFGAAHAEPRLLAKLSGRSIPPDAELFLTLEPCSYHGKTPPCVDALLASPIRRFVVATTDPNPKVRGRGITALRRAGRQVRLGVLASEAKLLNLPYFTSRREGRARVTLKIASTADGMVADFGGGSRWITGAQARREVGRLRARCDAIVVGRGTVERDDPRLRSSTNPSRSPTRIVLDSRLRVDPNCRLARLWREDVGVLAGTSGTQVGNWLQSEERRSVRWVRRPRLVVVAADPPARRRAAFERAGWEIWNLPADSGRIDLRALAGRASREGLIDLLVEPGPALVAGFLGSGPVDRILLFLAPKILGGKRGWSGSMAPRALGSALRAALRGPTKAVGPDLLLELTGPRGRALVPASRLRNGVDSL
jgi:diaminohydroxyphosphoribosylaminopyrimidine deaminase/5-amino-6-(5-phosphoribosylamino)uracil reductase